MRIIEESKYELETWPLQQTCPHCLCVFEYFEDDLGEKTFISDYRNWIVCPSCKKTTLVRNRPGLRPRPEPARWWERKISFWWRSRNKPANKP